MIDISQYRLLTPANSTLNIEDKITVFYKDGEIKTFENNNSQEIDLTLISGVQTPEFNLVFKNHTEQFVKDCQRSEDWLQALYYMFNFQVNSNWVEVTQHNELEFLDAMYYFNEEQPEAEEPTIIV